MSTDVQTIKRILDRTLDSVTKLQELDLSPAQIDYLIDEVPHSWKIIRHIASTYSLQPSQIDRLFANDPHTDCYLYVMEYCADQFDEDMVRMYYRRHTYGAAKYLSLPQDIVSKLIRSETITHVQELVKQPMSEEDKDFIIDNYITSNAIVSDSLQRHGIIMNFMSSQQLTLEQVEYMINNRASGNDYFTILNQAFRHQPVKQELIDRYWEHTSGGHKESIVQGQQVPEKKIREWVMRGAGKNQIGHILKYQKLSKKTIDQFREIGDSEDIDMFLRGSTQYTDQDLEELGVTGDKITAQELELYEFRKRFKSMWELEKLYKEFATRFAKGNDLCAHGLLDEVDPKLTTIVQKHRRAGRSRYMQYNFHNDKSQWVASLTFSGHNTKGIHIVTNTFQGDIVALKLKPKKKSGLYAPTEYYDVDLRLTSEMLEAFPKRSNSQPISRFHPTNLLIGRDIELEDDIDLSGLVMITVETAKGKNYARKLKGYINRNYPELLYSIRAVESATEFYGNIPQQLYGI